MKKLLAIVFPDLFLNRSINAGAKLLVSIGTSVNSLIQDDCELIELVILK